MQVLNLIRPEKSSVKYRVIQFPDGEPHIILENIDRKDGSPKESQSQMDRTGTCDSSIVKRDDLDWWKQFGRANAQNLAQQQLLEEKIAEEEARSKELDEYSEYMKTDEFAEWYAKEKLGLIHKNEIIFKGE